MLRWIIIASVSMFLFIVDAAPARADEKSKTVSEAGRVKLLKTFVSEFVAITPGKGKFPRSFQMGSTSGTDSEQPVHKVTLAHSFSIAKYEVPQNLYEAVMGSNPSQWKGPRNSAEMFSWKEARSFCEKTTRLLRDANLIGKNEEIRMPTEAEWEYCCRAGTKTIYSFGDSATKDGDKDKQASILDEYGWHTGNASGNDPPVGAKKPNQWGLYDTYGYLWEFVADEWHDSYKAAPSDGSCWSEDNDAKHRVMRGGAWTDRYEKLTSSYRMRVASDFRSPAVGLRCVKASVRKSKSEK